MVKVKNPKIGQLVQVPVYEFAPARRGWNGWIFRVGIIEKLYVGKTGKKCATVRYCSKRASRYELLPCEEHSMNFVLEHVFEWDSLVLQARLYKEGKEVEAKGEQVCWSEDIAFLVNNGFIE